MFLGLNSTTGASQDYRGLLVAKITAVNTPASGLLGGKLVYDWVEQVPVNGGYTDAEPARRGSYVSATDYNNVIIDANNSVFAVGQFVWARMKCASGGTTIYETVYIPVENPPDGGSDCLKPVPGWDEDTCLLFGVQNGTGKCANIVAQSIFAPGVGAAPGTIWTGEDTIPVATGDGTIVGSIEDGEFVLDISVTGSGGTETARGQFAGCTNGRPTYSFGGPILCNQPVDEECLDNVFLVTVVCVSCTPVPPYDPGICDCDECPDGTPESFSFTLAGGTGDFAGANGDWTVTNGGGGCTWTGTLAGWTATYSYAAGIGTVTVVNDGDPGISVTYSKTADCCGPNQLNLGSSSGTGTPPARPTLTGAGNCGPCLPVDTECCVEDTPAVLYATFTGSLSGMGTVYILYDASATPPGWVGVSTNSEPTRVQWYCTGGQWVMTFEIVSSGVVFSGAATGIGNWECAPFLASPSGSDIPPGGIGPYPAGPYAVLVSETPP